MSNLIPQQNNMFIKVWNWFKRILFKKDKIINNNENIIKQETENIENNLHEEEKNVDKFVYNQDLDYDSEKKRIIGLYNDVINEKIRLEDLEFADIVRVKLLLKN